MAGHREGHREGHEEGQREARIETQRETASAGGDDASGGEGGEADCCSGLEWLGVSGCGRRRRVRRDPFTVSEANDRFYQECAADLDGALSPAFQLALTCDVTYGAAALIGAGGACGAGDGGRRREGAGGDSALVCRVYVMGPREEFTLRGGDGAVTVVGLEAEGCVVPNVFVPLALAAPPNMAADDLANDTPPSAAAVVSGAAGAGEGGKGAKGRGRGRGKGGAGGGVPEDLGGEGGASGAEAWPELAPSTTAASKWGKGNGAEGEEGGRGKGKGGRERDKLRPLNPLEDALEAMFLATKVAVSDERPVIKEDCLVAVDLEGRAARRMLAEGLSVEAADLR